jgi:hypothetical protein
MTGNADGKSKDVEKTICFVFPEIAKSQFEKIFNHTLILNCQLPTANCQPPTVNRQPSTILILNLTQDLPPLL